MKCLIVDDEPLALMRLHKMLQTLGVSDIKQASNGKKALETVQSWYPQVVFLDIEMPVMKGIEAAQHIRKLAPDTHIVFCTAYDDFAIDAFDLSASDYLLKPVTHERLSQALKKVSNNDLQETFTFQQGADILSLSIDEIYCFISEEKATFMHCHLGTVIIDESLLTLEKRFANHLMRIHRNALINVSQLCGLHRDGTLAHVKLRNTDYQPQISRRNINKVKQLLT